MKKLSLFIVALSLFLSGFGQTENPSTSLGEMLLSDDALIAALQKVDAKALEDASGQLEYHLSYIIGDRAETIPDFRKIFFSTQCKHAMTTVVEAFDNSGLTLELLRIAPDFLTSYTYASNEMFAQNLIADLEIYHLTAAQITSALPEVVEAQTRFEVSKSLPVAAMISEGMLPLLEKCLNTDQNEAAKKDDGYIVHPFTIGTHTTQKGYSAGGALIVYSLQGMIKATQEKDPAKMTQSLATMLAVWVNVPGEVNF